MAFPYVACATLLPYAQKRERPKIKTHGTNEKGMVARDGPHTELPRRPVGHFRAALYH